MQNITITSYTLNRHTDRPDASLNMVSAQGPVVIHSLLSQSVLIHKEAQGYNRTFIQFDFKPLNNNGVTLNIDCDAGVLAHDLGWQLRQYAVVSPPDQNHDTSQYIPLGCPQCCENVGICFHVLFADVCLAHVAPFICSMGAYPFCTINLAGRESTSTAISHETMTSEVGCCLSTITQCFVTVDDCSSGILSILAVPTRGAGRCCGLCIRETLPDRCKGGRCFEGFNGPPPYTCTCERCVSDYAAGLGNCYTHMYRGSLQAATRGRKRYVEGCTELFVPPQPDSDRLIMKPVCCCVTPVSAARSQAYKRAGHSCCSSAVNIGCLYMLAPEDIILIGPITECMDTLINSDIYLQGPVIKQGYLKVSGSCSQSYRRAWVVLRPWSLSVYRSPDDVNSVRGPILIPTSSMFSVSESHETPGQVEVRTIDFSRYRFSPCSDSDDLSNAADTSNSAPIASGGGGSRQSVQPELSDTAITSMDERMIDWRYELRLAASRTESLTPYDQGVRKKGSVYSQSFQSMFPDNSAGGGGGNPRQSSSSPHRGARSSSTSSRSSPTTVVMEGRSAGPAEVPLAVAVPVQDGYPPQGLRQTKVVAGRMVN